MNRVETVKLLALRVNKKNRLSVISKNGKKYMTGGILCKITPRIKVVLDTMPGLEHYEFLNDITNQPFDADTVKLYMNNNHAR
tara:strand:+ start:48 stop:296 length:249 start_codon:yes stop_codon:yes gene_type:complete